MKLKELADYLEERWKGAHEQTKDLKMLDLTVLEKEVTEEQFDKVLQALQALIDGKTVREKRLWGNRDGIPLSV